MVPKTTCRFCDLLGGLTRLTALIYYGPRKSHMVQSLRKPPGPGSQGASQDALNSSSTELWQHVWSIVYQGSSLETQCPVFMGVGHMGILCLACPRVPDLQRKSRYSSTKHTGFTVFAVRLSYLARVGTVQKPKFPESSQRPTLQADLSKDRVSGWLC